MAIKYKWYPSPSYTNNSHRVDLIVLHTTEGATTNDAIKNYLCGPNGVSYHGSVDNQMKDVCYEYVYEDDKSWSCCDYNGKSLNYVFCTPNGASANWSRDYWLNNQSMALHTMAQVVADQAKQWNVPLVALSSSQAQSGQRGVCQHMNLGGSGCGHSDCGNMPIDKVIEWAKGGSQPTPAKERLTEPVQFIGSYSEPIPPGSKTLYIATDVGKQGLGDIGLRVALHNNTAAGGWEVTKDVKLTQDKPKWAVSTVDHDIISIDINTEGACAGFCYGS